MGGFHEGHTSLIKLAASLAKQYQHNNAPLPVIVSIFVNPAQFDEPADYERYPRVLEDDAHRAHNAGATCVFAPDVQTIYPTATNINTPPVPDGLTTLGLEDTYRPGHLEGVWKVVHRLFCLVQPSIAVFGQKDWQQLQLVTQLAHTMRSRNEADVIIEAGTTIREHDGLAMSSRNRFITPTQRPAAASLSKAMQLAQQSQTSAQAESLMRDHMLVAGVEVEYATVRDAQTLEPLPPDTSRTAPGLTARSFVAGRLGKTRILDNMPWTDDR
jgi:pantoate--beta-alanine ligase